MTGEGSRVRARSIAQDRDRELGLGVASQKGLVARCRAAMDDLFIAEVLIVAESASVGDRRPIILLAPAVYRLDESRATDPTTLEVLMPDQAVAAQRQEPTISIAILVRHQDGEAMPPGPVCLRPVPDAPREVISPFSLRDPEWSEDLLLREVSEALPTDSLDDDPHHIVARGSVRVRRPRLLVQRGLPTHDIHCARSRVGTTGTRPPPARGDRAPSSTPTRGAVAAA